MDQSFRQLLSLMSHQPATCVDVASVRDQRRFLPREFSADLPLRLEHMTFPAYEPPLQRWWLHWHDYYEIIIPLEGAGLFQIGDVDAPFAPGQILLVDTLKLHGGAEVTRSHRSLVILFQTSMVAPGGGLAADRAFLEPLAARALPPEHPLAPDVMRWVLRLAEAFYGQGSPRERYPACKLALLGILERLHAIFGPGGADGSLRKRQERLARLQAVLPWLEARCAEPISQPEVAKLAGMSPSRFRAFFRETTGDTLATYLRGLRVNRAAERLRSSEASLAEIAAETGFSDQSHLFRCFRAAFGCGPLEFRRRNMT
jgi:AraC-like DNA-binding protein